MTEEINPIQKIKKLKSKAWAYSAVGVFLTLVLPISSALIFFKTDFLPEFVEESLLTIVATGFFIGPLFTLAGLVKCFSYYKKTGSANITVAIAINILILIIVGVIIFVISGLSELNFYGGGSH